jgi:hypothetical protein
MKLEEKGKFLPPPVLDKYAQLVSTEIQKWNNIIAATHWYLYDTTQVDGADFYVGEEELGHIHLDGSVHLATSKELKKILLDNKLAQNFPYGKNWVQFQIASKEDAEKAIKLFQLNYERINGISINELNLKVKTTLLSATL